MGRLTGRRVVVTRPREKAAPLVAALEAEGAAVIEFPTIEIRAPEDRASLDGAAARLAGGGYDWVVLTSSAGVEALQDALLRVQDTSGHGGAPFPSTTRVACVGPSTAASAGAAGWPVAVIPPRWTGEALGGAIVGEAAVAGRRVLFPRAEDAREALVTILRGAGADVDEVVAYRKVVPEPALPYLGDRIRRGEIDALTFTSPSTVLNFEELLGPAAFSPPIVAIGPTTAEAVEAITGKRAVVAEDASVPGLVDAVVHAVQQRRREG